MSIYEDTIIFITAPQMRKVVPQNTLTKHRGRAIYNWSALSRNFSPQKNKVHFYRFVKLNTNFGTANIVGRTKMYF